MHDIKAIKQDPAAFDAGMKRRGLPALAANLVAQYEVISAKTQEMNDLQAKRNATSKQIGAAMGQGKIGRGRALKGPSGRDERATSGR